MTNPLDGDLRKSCSIEKERGGGGGGGGGVSSSSARYHGGLSPPSARLGVEIEAEGVEIPDSWPQSGDSIGVGGDGRAGE